MKRVLILVEGQTEETFVREILFPHLSTQNIYLTPTLIVTKRVVSGPNFKGGINSYAKQVRRDLLRLLGDSNAAIITTMIDFYARPEDFPQPKEIPPKVTAHEKVGLFEDAFRKDIDHPKFLPYLSLHEFEALLFTEPENIAKSLMGDNKQKEELQKIRNQFETPEHINDNYETAPSRRIISLFPSYRKPLYGSLISRSIGLDRICAECPHFNQWLLKLENLAEEQ